MDIIFSDGTKRTVRFDAEYAARIIRKHMAGDKPGYRIELNPENDRKTQQKQFSEIEHYLSEFDRIAGLAGKL